MDYHTEDEALLEAWDSISITGLVDVLGGLDRPHEDRRSDVVRGL